MMEVAFRRTGTRRYAVIVTRDGEPARVIDPAPGYDDDIPHDLVHYLVEAELGLTYGVYGSAARGGGTFTATPSAGDMATRERKRERRKQQKRERALRAHDAGHGAEMKKSERLAGLCDVVWRRKQGQRPDPGRPAPLLRAEDAADVERVVVHLDAIAPLWRELLVDGELVFEWPAVTPLRRQTTR
ncbi:MAG TPA: hypothetical protein VI197_16450 [Polyangiaceae bacterium]